MYNQTSSSEQKGLGPPLTTSPRISFSNDFVESSPHIHAHTQMRSGCGDAPVSSDFEFSVSNHSMMSADELFFRGRLLPLKESCSNYKNVQKAVTTLRDELQNDDEDADGDSDFSLRAPRNPTRWRGFLGLRKSHIGSKKSDDDKGEKSVEEKRASCNKEQHDDDDQCSNKS